MMSSFLWARHQHLSSDLSYLCWQNVNTIPFFICYFPKYNEYWLFNRLYAGFCGKQRRLKWCVGNENPLNIPPRFIKVLEWNEVDLGQTKFLTSKQSNHKQAVSSVTGSESSAEITLKEIRMAEVVGNWGSFPIAPPAVRKQGQLGSSSHEET